MKNVDVIIIGKNYSTSLGIIKALGEFGYGCAVIKLANQKPIIETPEVKSKYVVSYTYANDLNDQNVLEAINQYRGLKKKVIIPSDDYAASLLDRYYKELYEDFYIPNMGEVAGNLSSFMDKQKQKELAAEMGMRVTKCWSVDVKDAFFQLPKGIIYPCFTKPQKSIGAPKTFIKKCDNEKDLKEQLKIVSQEYPCRVLIEEAVVVENEYTVPGICLAGTVIIPAFLRKVKTGSGKHKGVTAIGVIEDAKKHSEVVEKLKKMVATTNMTGIFDIELLESCGEFFLNEVNLRYGAAGYAVTAMGINLPRVYVDYLYGRESTFTNSIEDGKVFVSEKAELDDYEAGFCSWKEYKNEIKRADIRFMYGKGDVPSKGAFKLLELKTRLKKRLKSRR